MLKDYSTLLLWAHRASPRSLRITPQDGSRPSFHTPPLCRASPPPAARRRRGEDGWGERKAKPDEGIRAAPARRTFGERGVSFTAGAPWLESRWRGPSLPSVPRLPSHVPPRGREALAAQILASFSSLGSAPPPLGVASGARTAFSGGHQAPKALRGSKACPTRIQGARCGRTDCPGLGSKGPGPPGDQQRAALSPPTSTPRVPRSGHTSFSPNRVRHGGVEVVGHAAPSDFDGSLF